MPRLLSGLLKLCVLPTALAGAMFGVLWVLARWLPGETSVRVGAAAVALGFGLFHARLIDSVSPPIDVLRWFNRLVLAALWLAYSQHVCGRFLNATAGGGFRSAMIGDLRALRSAVADYRREHRVFPDRLEGLLISSATLRIPYAWTGRSGYARALVPHAGESGVEYFGNEACLGATNARLDARALKDTGRWGYVNDPRSACRGTVFVDCTHSDYQGRLWADY